jgi:hypothetical protein
MEKTDFKKTLKHLYSPSPKEFGIVDVPRMQFLKVDGMGDPGTSDQYANAVAWLYGVAYPIKFASKNSLSRDYVVPPLEGLWWADDLSAFAGGERDKWQWTMMIMQPEWITEPIFAEAVSKASKKLGTAPDTVRLETFDEGLSVQILHVGPYADEAPTIARLHKEFLPDNDLAENGHHHEIYLNDPRKTEPARLKTVLRNPVRRRGQAAR